MRNHEVRLDVGAMLREKAKRFRQVADLFDRAAEAEGSDRGVILEEASRVLDDIMMLSNAARIETEDRARES